VFGITGVIYTFMMKSLLLEYKLFNFQCFDAAAPWQISFQDSATAVMEGIVHFHHDIIFYLVVIIVVVMYLLGSGVRAFRLEKHGHWFPLRVAHDTELEVIWTVLPAVILFFIAVPSFSLLYAMDEVVEPVITLKIAGHQWYWEYSHYDQLFGVKEISYESYMVATEDLAQTTGYGSLRLLEVTERVALPIEVHIRLLVSSSDVLHSWAVPSLGIKVDACPGRLNQVGLFLKRGGVFYGQCSEICGVNHGFMPIVVEGLDTGEYIEWVARKLISRIPIERT
jgi:cytochrome c oxidase subunit 2